MDDRSSIVPNKYGRLRDRFPEENDRCMVFGQVKHGQSSRKSNMAKAQESQRRRPEKAAPP
uniref:Uncharacterized protein n=1 Tax=Romanomermis culicivorax TaxID=13658 RepID=A0A915HYY4_ROMCU